ncbi:unknown [Firmicutes bacterium CAG:137]|nr:unknown [Firmicutes bacterium CAG:137]
MHQVGGYLDRNFFIRDGGVGKPHVLQVGKIGWAAVLRHAEIVDKLFGNLQRTRFRLLGQKLTFNEVGNILAVAFAAMGMVIHQTFFNQFAGSHISGLLKITGDFLDLGLFRGKRRGQRLDLLHAEGHIRPDFFLRAGMVKERAKQPMDSLPLNGIMELLGDIFHCLGVIFAVTHTGAVKFPDQAQNLGGQCGIGVCGFFF